ncbi:MAG: uncharacterized protein A8A55_0812 [Amphiamblys sp. WSBS2006]|nr:MAG: uncharacterized protein A8A55_0812 [Amphiamblys sp. WSBS2006]
MFVLLHESFARHGDSFFLRKDGGVLILSEAFLKNEYEDVKRKGLFLYEQGQKVLEVAKQNVLKNAASEVCHNLSLTQDLPNEPILLTEKTTATLSNIEMSEKLFFVLLEKTKVTIGERFSITKHVDSENCIRESSMARETPFYLSGGVLSSLALENIERMPPKSIGCVLKEVNLYRTGLINILSKLGINEESKVKWLGLSTREKEHVAEILAQNQVIYVGSVEKMTLENYAVSILPKLKIHQNSEVELFGLYADEAEHVSAILSQDQIFCVGKVKEMEFCDYAVFVFLKMKKVVEDPENLLLSINGDEMWKKIHEKLEKENTAICIEEVEKLILSEHSPSFENKRRDGQVFLDVKNEDQISEVLAEEYKGISFGGIKEFVLSGSAVNLLPKMRIGEDCEVVVYGLTAAEERNVSNVLEKDDRSIATGRVKNMMLVWYAVCVITKLRIHKDNTMEIFVLSADEWHLSRILEEGDGSIEVGRIELGGFRVPEKIRRKMRYTLVGGEENEVLEEIIEEAAGVGNGEVGGTVDGGISEVVDGEGSEVLEEKSSSQCGIHLD